MTVVFTGDTYDRVVSLDVTQQLFTNRTRFFFCEQHFDSPQLSLRPSAFSVLISPFIAEDRRALQRSQRTTSSPYSTHSLAGTAQPGNHDSPSSTGRARPCHH